MLADESLPIAARVLGFEAEHFADFKFRPHETGGEQNEVGRPFFFGAFHFAKGRATFDRFGPIDLDGFHRDDVAAVIADKFLGEDVVRARVVAVFGFVFGVRIVEAIHARPLRPRIVRGALGRRLVEQLKIHDALAAVPQRGADAIRAGVAAANDDHVFVLGRGVRFVLEIGIEQALGAAREEIHRELYAVEVAAGVAAGGVEGLGRSGGHQQRVVFLQQIVGVDEPHFAAAFLHDLRHVAGGEVLLFADVRAGDKLDTLLAQQIHATLDDALVEFHIRDAVHQQTADAIGALVNGDRVADFVQLIRRRQTGGAGADDGDLFAGAFRGRFGGHPAFLEGAIDDRVFDILDRHRRIVDAEHARAFARRGAHATGELREIIRLVQSINRLAPTVLVNEMVPLGDEIIDRATGAGLAKRHTAIHTTRALRLQMFLAGIGVDLIVVVDALQRIAIRHRLALELHKSCWLTH